MHFLPALGAAAALFLPLATTAQTTIITAQGGVTGNDPCRASVSRFEQTIGFIRENQGTQAAQELKERLLPAKLESDILFREGYCGLAKYLKEKKLDR
jgi:hypothetical protein